MPTGALLTFVLLGTFTPGPNNIMAMESARRAGFWGSRFFILGMASGFFFVMLFCALFNLLLGKILPGIQTVLGGIGALYMLYLAIKPFLHPKRQGASNPGAMHSCITGFVLQFLNPKLILYGIVIMSGFILPWYSSPFALVLFSLGLTAVGLLSLICWALFGAIFQRYFAKHEALLNIVMAVLLVWCATTISGIRLS